MVLIDLYLRHSPSQVRQHFGALAADMRWPVLGVLDEFTLQGTSRVVLPSAVFYTGIMA